MVTFEVTVTNYEFTRIIKCKKYENLVLDNPILMKDLLHDIMVDGLTLRCTLDDVEFLEDAEQI